MFYRFFLKELIDKVLSFILLIIFAPILIFIVFILFFVNKGTPFFIQTRPGKDEKLFKIIKFKTMTDKRNSDGTLLSDAERLTKIGLFVRKSSLDELPQLINVLKGDMSFIGPRPLLVDYLALYNCEQKRRHNIRPGITGWAQVNGRNSISWKQKFELDVWYVDNMSFVLDFKIFLLTLRKVFIREGINSATSVTMEGFNGHN